MLRHLFSNFGATRSEMTGAPRKRGLAMFRQAYDDWRFERDIVAIMATLDRLSDRQLHLIGVARDSLFETVEDMVRSAERERLIGRDVIALLDAPTPSANDLPKTEAAQADLAEPVGKSQAA